MSRHPFRSAVRLGVALAIAASVTGVAHAASLGGFSADTLGAWSYAADIVIDDTTPPTITATVAPPANPLGWHNTSATVTFDCDDETGISACTGPVTISGEAAGQVVVGEAVDTAGNTASTSMTLDVDLTGPVVEIVGVDDGDVVAESPTVTCTATDALSGVVGACVATVEPGPDGQFIVTATARDFADNVTVETAEYRVSTICSGPPNLPCVIPFGVTFDGTLNWNADVLVLGQITGGIMVLDGPVTVGSTGVVGDDITQTGTGGVAVLAGGIVNGSVAESGPGAVVIDGHLSGNVLEADDGDLVVGVAAVVSGTATERGAGSLIVAGTVTGDVVEEGDGDLTLASTAAVANALESGVGSVFVSGSVSVDVRESGVGDLNVQPGANVGGDAIEDDAGNLTVTGPSSVSGEARELLDGNMTVNALAFVGIANSSGNGTCVISPLATVPVRTGKC